MAHNDNGDLHLRLVLYDRNKNVEASDNSTVWYPTDNLVGHLEIFSAENLNLDAITVYFEGVSRTWMSSPSQGTWSPTIIKAERKFLSQAYDVPLAALHQEREADISHYNAPFYFVISRLLLSPSADSPDQCLHLPPSLELGGVIHDDAFEKRFAQPCISYCLRATVSTSETGENAVKSTEISIPVVVMPHTDEFPPTDTNDFPTEFKEHESKPLRRSLSGGTFGKLHISTQEPQPLIFNTISAESGTRSSLKLEIEASSSSDVYERLQSLSFVVISLIRVKTFYSVRAFPVLPSQVLLQEGGMRLRDDLVNLKKRSCRDLSWSYSFDIGEALQLPLHNHSFGLDSNDRSSVRSEVQAALDKPHPPKGRWTTQVEIPIEVHTRLLPTFCSALVASLYSILYRVKVSGIWNDSFDLEVPVQVVQAPPEDLSPGRPILTTRNSEAFQEDLAPLTLSRASTSFSFDTEIMELGQSPPRYDP